MLNWDCNPFSQPDLDNETISENVEPQGLQCWLITTENWARIHTAISFIDDNFSNVDLSEGHLLFIQHYNFDPITDMFFDRVEYEIDAEGTWNYPDPD